MSNLKKAHPTTPLKRGSPHAGEFAILESTDLQSPYGLVLLIAVCVFLGEALVMLILSILPDLSTVFERLHTRMDYKGTGIGLAIVKKAVSILGGSIRIESKLGEGSTFFITLPKAQEAGQIRSRIILRKAVIETRDI